MRSEGLAREKGAPQDTLTAKEQALYILGSRAQANQKYRATVIEFERNWIARRRKLARYLINRHFVGKSS